MLPDNNILCTIYQNAAKVQKSVLRASQKAIKENCETVTAPGNVQYFSLEYTEI